MKTGPQETKNIMSKIITSSPASNDYSHSIWRKSNEQRILLLRRIISDLVDFEGLHILDVGAGNFEISNALSVYGANVTALEPRGNIEFQTEPRVEVVQTTLEDYRTERKFDLVLALGFLYHMCDPDLAIRQLATLSSRFIAIDSVVLDSDAPLVVFLEEDKSICGNSIDGRACRPSPQYIIGSMHANDFNLVIDCSKFLEDIESDGISTGHCYSWDFKRTCGWRRDEKQLRKFLIFERKLI